MSTLAHLIFQIPDGRQFKHCHCHISAIIQAITMKYGTTMLILNLFTVQEG